MESLCTPENSPISEHGMETNPSTHHRRTPTPVVLDLCIRRTQSKSPPNEIHSPKYVQTNSPILQTNGINYLVPHMQKSPPPITRIEYPTEQKSPPVIPPTNRLSSTTVCLPDTTIPPAPLYHPTALLINSVTGTGLIKCTRPFKAYPKDPTILSTGESRESYTEFRRRMLTQVNNNNNLPFATSLSNIKMRRHSSRSNSYDRDADSNCEKAEKDAAYWERRRKNNEAAKRSRDARRAKEDEIAIRAAFLEHENMRLKVECAALRQEIAELRSLNY